MWGHHLEQDDENYLERIMNSNNSSRTSNTIKSTAAGLVGYAVTYIATFIYRTVFIYLLGQTYLGIQGLFSNILSMLSLAELGISTAITFSLYKPIASNDKEKIKSLMHYFKIAYLIIGGLILLIGLSLTPFLDFFIKERPDIPESLILIYLLFIADTVVSYALVHKQAIIRADQKVYIISIATNACHILRDICQIIWLLIAKNYIPVLIIQILSTFLLNAYLANKANKLYPYLKDKNISKLDEESKRDITEKVKSLFFYKIGAFIVNGTDNLLISKFIGIITVGVYSNYNTLIAMIKTLTNYFIKAVTPSVGNYTATKTVKESEMLFYELNFLVFWIFSFCSAMFIGLINPFIIVWIGKDYLLDLKTVWIIILNFYLYGLHQNQLIYRNVLGLYTYCRWKPIVEAIINIIASLLFIKLFGLFGVFLGTTASFVCTSLWVEPYVLYKYYFKASVKKYALDYTVYFIYSLGVCVALYFITSKIQFRGIFGLAVIAIVCLLFHTVTFFLLFSRTKEFAACKMRVLKIFNRG
jgi:O-antigen/teichoic acid export membrane protein